MDGLASTIGSNLQRVRERITRAAEATGRTVDDVTLVGVTKYVGRREAAALAAAGCRDLGESRPQQLWETAGNVDDDVRWHLIGHLQRNKVARTLPLVHSIHSVDSERLLTAIDTEAAKQSLRPHVLLEVNCSGDVEKHGFAREGAIELAAKLGEYKSIEIRGLMTMAARGGSRTTAAANFAALRNLRDEIQSNLPASIELRELSMGMTSDFEIAIAEGATIVRVGSALWEGLG